MVARAGARARRRARPAPVGRQAGAAVRLQRRRERALRPATRSASSATAGTRTTSSTRRRTRTCCTSSSTSGSAGAPGVSHALATDPTEVFVVARVTAAARRHARRVAAATWPGARLFDRASGLLAAALLAVAFLPVFYSHLALNDVPTLAPIALSLWGTAGVLRDGRAARLRARRRRARPGVRDEVHRRDRAAAALAAGAIRLAAPAGRNAAARGLVLAGVVALGAFVVANPYARARPRGLPRRPAAPGRRRRRRARQARPDPELRAPLLPVDVHLGAGLGAAAWPASSALGLLVVRRPPRAARARPGADPLRALHGHPGALLRALAAARLPDRLPARRLRDRAPDAARRAGARRRWRPALAVLGAVLAARAGRSSTRCTARSSLSRADTRNLARALDGRQRPGRHEDRRRAGRPRRLGAATSASPTAATANGARWIEVPDEPLEHRRRRRARPGRRADRQHRGLRAHALPRR